MSRKATPWQKRFVREYLKDFNATQAAIRSGYSQRWAAEIGYKLVHKSTVQDYIKTAQQKLDEQTQITLQELEGRLARYARMDHGAFNTAMAKGQLIKTSDQMKAIELLVRMKGGITDKLKLDITVITDEALAIEVERRLALANGPTPLPPIPAISRG